METQSRWASLLCLASAVALVSLLLAAGDATPEPVVEKTVPPPLPRSVDLRGFDADEERLMREKLRPKFDERCTEAFQEAGLISPMEVALTRGIVLRPARDLWIKEIGSLGLVYEGTRIRYQSEFSSGWAQAGTVPAVRDGWRLTVDGRARVFLYDSAFAGEDFFSRRFALEDVLTHELMHVGGQGRTPGWLGPLTHDLKGFRAHDKILKACR
jgi:hypothetical protein